MRRRQQQHSHPAALGRCGVLRKTRMQPPKVVKTGTKRSFVLLHRASRKSPRPSAQKHTQTSACKKERPEQFPRTLSIIWFLQAQAHDVWFQRLAGREGSALCRSVFVLAQVGSSFDGPCVRCCFLQAAHTQLGFLFCQMEMSLQWWRVRSGFHHTANATLLLYF